MKELLKAELNQHQYIAATTTDRPLLIIAGAGSGKTRVITYRIAYMLESGIPQNQILALTFTNKAAREMQQRIRELTGRKLQNLTISTFHAFGVQVLRDCIHLLGYRENFSIYDTIDQTSLLKETAREISFSLEGEDLRSILALFSDIRTGRQTWSRENHRYQDLFHEYRSHLKLYNSVDFDDLILLPIEIFRRFPDVLEGYRSRYRYFLVDEFQDTSNNQYTFIHFLASASRKLCVVGDDDQSIYSWRGADYGNILQFERDFPELLEVKLEQNYRSTGTILEAANGVIRNNENRKEKALWSGVDGGTPVEVYYPADEREEAAFVCERIRTLSLQEQIRYEDMCVLIRTNALSRSLEEAFLSENLPYRMTGGTSFFDRKEIRDIISYMRVAANHDDDMSLLRILNTPRRGLGRKTIEILDDIARRENSSLYSAIVHALAANDNPLPARASTELKSFIELIHDYRDRFLKKPREMAKTLKSLVEDIDYWQHLVSENQTNDKLARWKYRNIDLFCETLSNWERNPDNLDPTLFNYLNRITLQSREDEDKESEQGRVNLMTIHSAKGLEYRIVFVVGCEDGVIPHRRAIEDDPANIEEERRLFYVALTRAKERLYLTSCSERTVMRERLACVPSPFLEEIPEELITLHEPEQPVEQAEAGDYFSLIRAKLGQQ